jgi:hypothetical protein
MENVQMKKSKWFDGAKFVPAHVGNYMVNNGTSYQYWNGTYWGARSSTSIGAYGDKDWKSVFQSPTWRGIKK